LKLKFLILIPFIFTFTPSVNSEAYVKVKTSPGYTTKFKVKGDHLSTSKVCSEASSDIDRKKKKDGGSGKKDCKTITKVTKSIDSGWTTLSAGATHTYSLDTLGIEVGDPYSIQWDAKLGPKGNCGARSMTRRKGDTTNTYYMQNDVSQADCSTTRR
jgi:hypothetical protein